MPTVEDFYTANDAQSHKLLWAFYKKGHIPREEMKTIFNRLSFSQMRKGEFTHKYIWRYSNYNDYNRFEMCQFSETRLYYTLLGFQFWFEMDFTLTGIAKKDKDANTGSLRIYNPYIGFSFFLYTRYVWAEGYGLRTILYKYSLEVGGEAKDIDPQIDYINRIIIDRGLFSLLEYLIDKYELL